MKLKLILLALLSYVAANADSLTKYPAEILCATNNIWITPVVDAGVTVGGAQAFILRDWDRGTISSDEYADFQVRLNPNGRSVTIEISDSEQIVVSRTLVTNWVDVAEALREQNLRDLDALYTEWGMVSTNTTISIVRSGETNSTTISIDWSKEHLRRHYRLKAKPVKPELEKIYVQ